MSDIKYIVRIHEMTYPDGLIWGVFDTKELAKQALLQCTIQWNGETVRFQEDERGYFVALLPGNNDEENLEAHIDPIRMNEWKCAHPYALSNTIVNGS